MPSQECGVAGGATPVHLTLPLGPQFSHHFPLTDNSTHLGCFLFVLSLSLSLSLSVSLSLSLSLCKRVCGGGRWVDGCICVYARACIRVGICVRASVCVYVYACVYTCCMHACVYVSARSSILSFFYIHSFVYSQSSIAALTLYSVVHLFALTLHTTNPSAACRLQKPPPYTHPAGNSAPGPILRARFQLTDLVALTLTLQPISACVQTHLHTQQARGLSKYRDH